MPHRRSAAASGCRCSGYSCREARGRPPTHRSSMSIRTSMTSTSAPAAARWSRCACSSTRRSRGKRLACGSRTTPARRRCICCRAGSRGRGMLRTRTTPRLFTAPQQSYDMDGAQAAACAAHLEQRWRHGDEDLRLHQGLLRHRARVHHPESRRDAVAGDALRADLPRRSAYQEQLLQSQQLRLSRPRHLDRHQIRAARSFQGRVSAFLADR